MKRLIAMLLLLCVCASSQVIVVRKRAAAAGGGGGGADPAYVQGATYQNWGGTLHTVAFGANLTAGNAVVGEVTWASGTITITSIACGSNTFTLIGSPVVSAGWSAQAFYKANVSAGACAPTITFSASENVYQLAMHEVSGVSTTSPLDGSIINGTSGATGTNTLVGSNFTTAANGDYIFAAVQDINGSGTPYTVGTGYTARIADTTNYSLLTASMIQASASATTHFTASPGSNAFGVMMIAVALKK